MSEQEKTGALLVYLFACLHFEETEDRWWYQWCTSNSYRIGAADPFLSAVWWALRSQDDDPHESAEEWLGYVGYVYGYRNGRRHARQ